MLEDMGNAVKVLDRIIPAVNIQVENVPGFLEHVTGPPAWYGVYFEIPMEDGCLLVVEQGAIGPDVEDRRVIVEDYLCWTTEPELSQTHTFIDWVEFLMWYDAIRIPRTWLDALSP